MLKFIPIGLWFPNAAGLFYPCFAPIFTTFDFFSACSVKYAYVGVLILITFVPVPLLLLVFILVGIALLWLKNCGLFNALLTPDGSTLYAPEVALSEGCLMIRIPLEEPDLSCFFWFWTHEIRLSFDIWIWFCGTWATLLFFIMNTWPILFPPCFGLVLILRLPCSLKTWPLLSLFYACTGSGSLAERCVPCFCEFYTCWVAICPIKLFKTFIFGLLSTFCSELFPVDFTNEESIWRLLGSVLASVELARSRPLWGVSVQSGVISLYGCVLGSLGLLSGVYWI